MPSNEFLVEVDGVSKKFCRKLKRSFNYGLRDLGLQTLGFDRRTERLRPDEFWALKGVSFRLKRGESVGIVGPNGAGKTTLLKILSGLIKPDGGRVVVRGHTIPLFARGAGFSKVLSGRENIALNLLLLGLEPDEIEHRYESIVAFCELAPEMMDAPVKTYSSGMVARLGFACAVESNADLLLVDEALAVGDMRFRTRCYRKLNELRERGTSVILVTHSIGAVNNNTDRAIYLKDGRIVVDASTSQVTTQYEEEQLYASYLDKDEELKVPAGLTLSAAGTQANRISTGQTLQVRMARPTEFVPANLQISFEELPRRLGVVLDRTFSLPQTSGPIAVDFPQLGLVGGVYRVHATLASADGKSKLSLSTGLRVASPSEISQNIFFQPASWSLEEVSAKLDARVPALTPELPRDSGM